MGCWSLVFLATIITVTCAQQLEIQPNQQTIQKEVGSSIALTCRPQAEQPSMVNELTWWDPQKRRIESTNRASPMYIQEQTGDRGIILVLSSLTENQGGNYTCTAKYGSESLSTTINIDTYVDISFDNAPVSQYPVVGRDYTVKCKARGNPTPEIDWDKDGQSIVTNAKFVISPDGLQIKNVSEADDGVYKCTAVVPATGKILSRNIKVEGQVPPSILPLDPITIIEGATASAKCVATGKPPPSYKWIKMSESQDLSKTDRFQVTESTGQLRMTRVEFNDDGMYKCVAKNSIGEVEAQVKVNVLVKPRIYELLNVTAPIRSETKIICKVYGRPPPRVTFRKLSNNEPFVVGPQPDDRRIILEQEFFREKGEAFGTLVISNLSRTDDGLYECIAENTAEMAYRNGHITVEFPPTFERTRDLPPIWSWDNKPGNLSCLPEAIPNATIIWKWGDYEIQDNQNFKKIGNSPRSFLIVTPQQQMKYYSQYECIATNKYGKASVKIELKHAEVPRPIQQVRAETVTATTIKWSIVPANFHNGLPIRSFTVWYRRNQVQAWEFAENHTWSYGAPYILERLIPEQTYDFRFAARNEVGMGGFMNGPSITMPRRSEPAEPRILMQSTNSKEQNTSNREDFIVHSPYADHYELRWNVPNDNGDPIQHYLVRYCVTEKVSGEWRDKDCTEQMPYSMQYSTYNLQGLQPDTIYKIELRAHNAIGDSSPAQVRVRTARGVDPIVPVESPAMSSSAIIGIVIAAILLVLLVLDITCYSINRIGVIAFCCSAKSKHADEEDPKLGSYKAAPAHPSSLNLPQPIKLVPSPTDEREPLKQDEKPMSVEFDGTHVYPKTGEIIGKHSAV